MDNNQIILDHIKNKEESIKFKERRFAQWNENYSLYRDKVLLNRLTQRQPINVPIIRETIQSWISKIDEAPKLKFETRDKTEAAKNGEIVFNAIYDFYYDKCKLDILDNIEKKIVGLQGRGFKKIGYSVGEVFIDLIDPYDIEVDPRVNPLDLNTAFYLKQTHIYRSLKEILANPKYLAEGKAELKTYLDSKDGIIRAATDDQSYRLRIERLQNLGADNFDEFGASDIIIEINESYDKVWSPEDKKFIRYLRIIAVDKVVLYNKPLKDAIGIDKLPIVSWASDPDANDFWSDGIADNCRTFNKITNMYISQDLENRTYRNFGMYFFNTMNGTFQPRAFEAKPFGMFGVPGNPAEIVQQVKIEPLNDVANQITWLKNLIQSSVAQTPLERGVKEAGEQTLGQVQLSLKQSAGINQVVSKNYRTAWKELGNLFYQILEANSHGMLKLYKKGSDGNYYPKEVSPMDWKAPSGYEVVVKTEAESSEADDFDLKKIQYVKNVFINNPVAQNIADRKTLELLNWDTAEIDSVMAAQQPQQILPPSENPNAPSKEQNPQDSIKNTNALPENI